MLTVDHIVFATADLQAGRAWMTGRLRMPPSGGGSHPLFGTHNLLWPLGDAYLELIAIDPEAPQPERPRLFALGTRKMRERIAARPVLIHWVIGTGDADAALPTLAYDPGPPVAMTRGDLHWRLTVRDDGIMPAGGLLPSVVEWPADVIRPPQAMADTGLRLSQLLITGAAAHIAKVPALPGVHTAQGTPGLAAEILRADGSKVRFAAQT